MVSSLDTFQIIGIFAVVFQWVVFVLIAAQLNQYLQFRHEPFFTQRNPIISISFIAVVLISLPSQQFIAFGMVIQVFPTFLFF